MTDLRTPWRPLLLGILAVGLLDILDAFIFFSFRGVAPIRILQSIASGVLGPDAFTGGIAAAILGISLHFTIAAGIVLVLFQVSRPLPMLVNRPLLFGPVYGIIVWLVMNFVIVPLSAARNPAFVTATVINGLLIHMLGIGIPAAFAVRRARQGARSTV